ncbi:hypothetical protein [Actinospica sp.]|uniref:hypothetical protein n=1 Tax=Actinospica sp. TaxID=1872142 RepID=UPI002C74DC27|nr:hypothetical protein [Actinospica sp.]HWG24030.1 hypothetical protein [Actinospica sp.]
MAQRTAVKSVYGDTPRRLKLLTAALALLGLLLGLISALGLTRDSASLSSLKSRTTEVSATGELYYRLNDMDAQAANLLLVGYHPARGFSVPTSVNAAASFNAYNTDRSAADADLELIAENPSLSSQAKALLDSLGSYEADVADAFYVDQQAATGQQPATPPAEALAEYETASAILHGSMLPASSQIAATDGQEVDSSYSSDHSAMSLFGYAVLVLGLIAVAALMLGNHYYARRFRRRLSWLSAGAIVALVTGLLGLSTQLTAADHLHVAKHEAYDSIYALDRAQAVSDDANADESRWLLENRGPELQTSFLQKVAEVGGAGRGGYLGTELDNITFPGEGQAATAAAQAFDTYLQDDKRIRSDANGGELAAAVALDIGTAPGQSNADFNAYMAALGRVIQINTAQFDAAVDSGVGASAWAELVIGGLLLLAFVLQAGHLRLREYQ